MGYVTHVGCTLEIYVNWEISNFRRFLDLLWFLWGLNVVLKSVDELYNMSCFGSLENELICNFLLEKKPINFF